MVSSFREPGHGPGTVKLSKPASTNWPAVPVGEISVAIQTLLSMTSRSTFIREQLVQRSLVHALRVRVFAGALHGLTQALARDADSPLVKDLAKVVGGIFGDCEAECKKHEKHSVCKDCELEGYRYR